MASVHDSHLGFAVETVYGTAVAPNKFFELLSEGINGKYERITGEGLRKGQRTASKSRFVVNPKGAEGEVKFEVLDKGFGFFLPHMLGINTTTGASAPYTHTGTCGDLLGKSLTCQVARVGLDGTVVPFTYEGGKVTEWTLSNEVDGVLSLALGLDFESETIGASTGAYALATPTYPTGAQLLSFASGSVSIGGTQVSVQDVSIKGNNGLKTDRYRIGVTTKREPVEEGMREYEFEVKLDFEGVVHANRVASATAAGATAEIICTWTTPGGYSLTVTMPNARFDESEVNFDGAAVLEQSLKGMALSDDTGVSPIRIAYVTTDVTIAS